MTDSNSNQHVADCTLPPVVLHLVLTHHWFDEMMDGRKDIEYRAPTPHWKRLIWDRRERIQYARFARGYTRETFMRPVVMIDFGPCPYERWDGNYFRIHMPPIEMENPKIDGRGTL